jgi:hypothetical protein
MAGKRIIDSLVGPIAHLINLILVSQWVGRPVFPGLYAKVQVLPAAFLFLFF